MSSVYLCHCFIDCMYHLFLSSSLGACSYVVPSVLRLVLSYLSLKKHVLFLCLILGITNK
jgi:hypothetical protein